MAAPRARRRRCDRCKQLVEVLYTDFVVRGPWRGKRNLCDHCHRIVATDAGTEEIVRPV